ncbi:PTS-dependent dihydroxyacetone kinase, ADP-binding subunit DhaL [Paenibacillus sp. 32O-W]|uniref:dihydroxyacetone kinase subunit DhaL n=1 Tax=Paenibacillus sp. 32O-W TaxID=1695218 RepID=UPI0007211376|nr:dihydroxyacetone kinase subunit DhaL [Paenibacillus sp. 32O-W]ALS28028.1 PTS-dependent dihydroxyacetone kinase, ADP-binding subunit DhaL [Paenibacillus sp. 32O-W]
MKLTSADFIQALHHIADRIEREKDYLSDLDRAVGDGDHGVTMSIGWQAVKAKLAEFGGESGCGEISKAAGMTFLNAVGSSVGPLYATAFLRGGAVLQGKTELSDDDIVQFWIAAVNGILDRGKAQPGDKTMVDAWYPAMKAMESGRAAGKDLAACLEDAVRAAEEGAKATAEMLSKKGRSSRLGERSVGHRDPGATSAYMILDSFYQYVKSLAG